MWLWLVIPVTVAECKALREHDSTVPSLLWGTLNYTVLLGVHPYLKSLSVMKSEDTKQLNLPRSRSFIKVKEEWNSPSNMNLS